MAHFRARFILMILIGIGCKESDVYLLESQRSRLLTPQERMINKNWQYQFIEIFGVKYTATVEGSLDPAPEAYISAMELNRKRCYYSENHTYLANWLVYGDYEFSISSNEATRQPKVGAWDFNADNTQLIHNPFNKRSKTYDIITLTDSQFIRKHMRVMEHNGPDWIEGDTVEFIEHFVPVIQD